MKKKHESLKDMETKEQYENRKQRGAFSSIVKNVATIDLYALRAFCQEYPEANMVDSITNELIRRDFWQRKRHPPTIFDRELRL